MKSVLDYHMHADQHASACLPSLRALITRPKKNTSKPSKYGTGSSSSRSNRSNVIPGKSGASRIPDEEEESYLFDNLPSNELGRSTTNYADGRGTPNDRNHGGIKMQHDITVQYGGHSPGRR